MLEVVRESNNLGECKGGSKKFLVLRRNYPTGVGAIYFLALRANSELEISYAEPIARPTEEYPNKNYSLFTIHHSLFTATVRSHCTGITLIALIITIILLLILAGITLHFTLGENGILKNSEIATTKYKQAGENETKILNEVNRYVTNRGNIGEIAGGTNYKTDGTEFKTADKLDGSPIYAKYVKITIPSTGYNQIEHNIENVDKIWIDIGYSYVLFSNEECWMLPSFVKMAMVVV